MNDKDLFQRGLDFQEMVNSPGWTILKREIEQDLQNLHNQLPTLVLSDRIADAKRAAAKIEAFDSILSKVEQALIDKKEAAENLEKER